MKWISDKTPENSNLVHIKFSTGKTDFKLTGFYEPTENKWHRQDGSILDWAPNLEWLDETERSFTIEDMKSCWIECDKLHAERSDHGLPYHFFDKFINEKYNIDITK